MASLIEPLKRIINRRGKGDTKTSEAKSDITREQFHTLVRKAAQPIKSEDKTDKEPN